MASDVEANITKKLILAVERYPALYDPCLSTHRVRAETEKLWAVIAKEIHIPARLCQKKWNGVRTCFSRHLGQIRETCSLGAQQKPQKPYYLARYLDFLVPYTKPRRIAPSSLTDDIKQETSTEDSNQSSVQEQDVLRGDVSKYELPLDVSISTDVTQGGEGRGASSGEWRQHNDLRGQEVNNKCVGCVIAAGDCVGDPDLLFFKSLLPDIKLMSRQQKHQLRVLVLNGVATILDGGSC